MIFHSKALTPREVLTFPHWGFLDPSVRHKRGINSRVNVVPVQDLVQQKLNKALVFLGQRIREPESMMTANL